MTKAFERWEFHHVGLATSDFSGSATLLQGIGFAPEGDSFEDRQLGVRVMFLSLGGSRVEIVANLHGSETVSPWLQESSLVPYHLAYLVPDIGEAVRSSVEAGFRLIRGAVPAVAFSGRHVAFLSSRSKLLIELVELA